jgi:hypothetical protein
VATDLRLPATSTDDALAFLIEWIRSRWQNHARSYHSPKDPGFQFSIRSVIQARLREIGQDPSEGTSVVQFDETTNTAPFVMAAWELVRRGVLAPGMLAAQGQLRFPGDEFRLTNLGESRISSSDDALPLPSEHARFAKHLLSHAGRFRSSFVPRATEALRCYSGGLYFSCCVMSGAAAESILLSLTVAKMGDESRALAEYRKTSGTTKLIQFLQRQQNSVVQQRLDTFVELLRFWRDEAAHATDQLIDEEEAFHSLLLLLRFARFADHKWTELT